MTLEMDCKLPIQVLKHKEAVVNKFMEMFVLSKRRYYNS